MKVSARGFSVFVLVLMLIWSISAQESDREYSESTPYSPRVFGGKTTEPAKTSKNEKKSGPFEEKSVPLKDDQFLELSVSVLDKGGRFVNGLRRADFTVFIDDTESEIHAFVPGGDSVNLILLVDTSPSLNFDQRTRIAKFTQQLVDRIPPQKKLMIVQFSWKMQVMTPLTDNRAIILKAIKKLNSIGGTALYETIGDLFVNQLPNLPGREAVIIITDGINSVPWNYDYEHSLVEVEKSDAMIFPIYFDPVDQVIFGKNKKPNKSRWRMSSVMGISMYKDLPGIKEEDYELGRWYLNDLVNISGGRLLSTINSDESPNPKPIDGLMRELALRYFVRVRLPDNRASGSRHAIRVRVNRPGVKVMSRGSYMTPE